METSHELYTYVFCPLAVALSLVAIDATAPGYMWTVERARRSGASEDEIVGCLIAAVPAVGVANVVAAAPKLALALGYDVTTALEDIGLIELE